MSECPEVKISVKICNALNNDITIQNILCALLHDSLFPNTFS